MIGFPTALGYIKSDLLSVNYTMGSCTHNEIAALSFYEETDNEIVDILKSILIAPLWFIIASIAFTLLCTVILAVRANMRLVYRTKLIKNVFQNFSLLWLFSDCNQIKSNLTQRNVVLSHTIYMFFLISILSSMVSTNLVTKKKPFVLESEEDFFAPEMKNTMFALRRGSFAFNSIMDGKTEFAKRLKAKIEAQIAAGKYVSQTFEKNDILKLII